MSVSIEVVLRSKIAHSRVPESDDSIQCRSFLIAKEIKLIGIKILGVERSIVDIIPAVEIGQTKHEGLFVLQNLLANRIRYSRAKGVDRLIN